MKELNWPRSAFALGFVLGPALENYFFLAYQISGWSWLKYPLVVAILGVAGVTSSAIGPVVAHAQSVQGSAGADTGCESGRSGDDRGRGGLCHRASFSAGRRALSINCRRHLCPGLGDRDGPRWIAHPAQASRPTAIDLAALPPGEWSPSRRPVFRAYAIILGACALVATAILAGGHLAGAFAFLVVAVLAGSPRRPLTALAVAAGQRWSCSAFSTCSRHSPGRDLGSRI